MMALLQGTGSSGDVRLQETLLEARRGWDAGKLSFNIINDAFGTTLDEGYSSGMRLSVRFSPFLGDGVRGLLPNDLKRRARVEYWGLTAAFDIYTPTDLDANTTEALSDDRPYAGFMGGALFDDIVFRGAIDPSGYTVASLSLEGGLVGPSTRTEHIQRAWHNWLRNFLNRNVTPRDPQGWDVYQVPDAFLIGVRARLESDAFRASWGDGGAVDRHGHRGARGSRGTPSATSGPRGSSATLERRTGSVFFPTSPSKGRYPSTPGIDR
ncbi:MAG: lipid A deacylase LpxR family protein [Deltaproteobacteria bacterium]|nr:lipid A deacylase LpxR family protein [Deltaproteobacteria bacterium]